MLAKSNGRVMSHVKVKKASEVMDESRERRWDPVSRFLGLGVLTVLGLLSLLGFTVAVVVTFLRANRFEDEAKDMIRIVYIDKC